MDRLPDFLVIGAMKAGTTSLYEDLARQPGCYFPPGEKEPHALIDHRVLTVRGRRSYARLYRGAGNSQLCGDASTGYTKRPDIPGVAQRARNLLGPDLKAIYLIREPIARTVSQHHHELSLGLVPATLDDAIHRFPRLINYSKYAYQLRPWLEEFGGDRIQVIRFEDYVMNRLSTMSSVCRFLGIEPRHELVDTERVYGKTVERSLPRGPFWRMSRTSIYRRFVRRWLPDESREWLRRKLLPTAAPRPPAPQEDTLRCLADKLAPEVEELRRMLSLDAPLWDLEEVIRSQLEPRARGRATALPAPMRP
ncbi:MAG: sulfotransferase domain-containing protein [bacterium]